MRSKATPGPWKWRVVASDPEYGHGGTIHAMLLESAHDPGHPWDPCVLAVREDWHGYLDQTEHGHANATLIASAPDLLAFAQDVLADIEDGCADLAEIEKFARIVVRKARGFETGTFPQRKFDKPGSSPL